MHLYRKVIVMRGTVGPLFIIVLFHFVEWLVVLLVKVLLPTLCRILGSCLLPTENHLLGSCGSGIRGRHHARWIERSGSMDNMLISITAVLLVRDFFLLLMNLSCRAHH